MNELSYPYSTIKESPSEMVKSWMLKFQRGVDQEINEKDATLCMNLINEERIEVDDEVFSGVGTYRENVNKTALTKELCDLIWVCYFCGHKFGLPIDAAFSRVYYSNMSKLGENGEPLLREDGKILKGPNYQPADLGDLFD